MGPSPPQALAPTDPSRRIHVLDVLRGFALFGILVVNMELFSHPVQLAVVAADTPVDRVDRAAHWVVSFLADGKFFSLFTLLFGVGFAIQMGRAADKGVGIVPVYLRRLLFLLGIGLAHAYLIWVGDVLAVYALLGFVLILFRNTSPRALVRWAVVLLSVPLLVYAFAVGMIALATTQPDVAEQIQESFQKQRQAYLADIQRAYAVYAGGTFAEITAQRAYDMHFMALGVIHMAPIALGMFLVGLWLARRRVFEDIEGHLPFFRRLLLGGGILGVLGSAFYASLIGPDIDLIPSLTVLVGLLGLTFGAPALCLAYVAALTLLNRNPSYQRRLAPLAPVGRMALTNYLGQSVICTLIFYGYGLGLFGQVDKAEGLLLAAAVFAAQVYFSGWWLGRFQYGPMEWAWRSLTYLKWQPMRNAAAPPPSSRL
jgi:uncharacterized protein